MANFFNRSSNRPRLTREEARFQHEEKLRKIEKDEKVGIAYAPFLSRIIIAVTASLILLVFVVLFCMGKITELQLTGLISVDAGIGLLLNKIFGRKN